MTATLSSKGQITIPAAIRSKLDIKTGDTLNFLVLDDGMIALIPSRTSAAQLKGIIPKPNKPITLEAMETAINTGGETC